MDYSAPNPFEEDKPRRLKKPKRPVRLFDRFFRPFGSISYLLWLTLYLLASILLAALFRYPTRGWLPVLALIGWLSISAAYVLHIFSRTAAGDDRLDSPPDLEWPDSGILMFWFLYVAGMAALPGLLLAPLAQAFGGVAKFLLALEWFLLFPIFTLGGMMNESRWNLFAPNVFRTMCRRPVAWLLFYAASYLLVLVYNGIGMVTAQWMKSAEGHFGWYDNLVVSVIGGAGMGLAFGIVSALWARLLGCLGRVVAEEISKRE